LNKLWNYGGIWDEFHGTHKTGTAMAKENGSTTMKTRDLLPRCSHRFDDIAQRTHLPPGQKHATANAAATGNRKIPAEADGRKTSK